MKRSLVLGCVVFMSVGVFLLARGAFGVHHRSVTPPEAPAPSHSASQTTTRPSIVSTDIPAEAADVATTRQAVPVPVASVPARLSARDEAAVREVTERFLSASAAGERERLLSLLTAAARRGWVEGDRATVISGFSVASVRPLADKAEVKVRFDVVADIQGGTRTAVDAPRLGVLVLERSGAGEWRVAKGGDGLLILEK